MLNLLHFYFVFYAKNIFSSGGFEQFYYNDITPIIIAIDGSNPLNILPMF